MEAIRLRRARSRRLLVVAALVSIGLVGCEQGDTIDVSTSSERTATTESRSPPTTTSTSTTSTTTTTTTTTLPPLPPPTEPPPPAPLSACDSNYTGCVPIASDVDCAGGSGDGPAYTGTVQVIGVDVYGLDADHDGVGCE